MDIGVWIVIDIGVWILYILHILLPQFLLS
jgi:hypothetical protein